MWFDLAFQLFLQSVPPVGNIFKIYDYDVTRPAWSLAAQVLKWFLMLQNNDFFNILHRSFVTTPTPAPTGLGGEQRSPTSQPTKQDFFF